MLDSLLKATYSFTMSKVMSTCMAHLWLGFLMCYGSSNFFYSTLNSGIIDSW
jgi:hypothetical protein